MFNKRTPFFSMLFLATLIISSFSCQQPEKTTLKMMTFNIRYNNPDDGENAWPQRKAYVVELIKNSQVDLVGVQEALFEQIQYLENNLPEYAWIGAGRDDGKQAGEFTAIFYRKDRLECLQKEIFWCSETPDTSSVGWDAALERIVNWGKFVDKSTEKTFYAFNTHFDHRGELARQESARLLIRRAEQISANEAAILLGDFNFDPDAIAYAIITDDANKQSRKFYDARTVSQTPSSGPAGTFTGFDINATPQKPIDYIFVQQGIKVLTHETINTTYQGKLPSDHYPVMTEILLP